MRDVAIIGIRWALYFDLGLLFGLPLFVLYARCGATAVLEHIPLAPTVISLSAIGLVLSIFGFVVQAAVMADIPISAPDIQIITALLNTTALGLALKIRLAALLGLTASATFIRRSPKHAILVSTVGGACALATLAWSGHAAAGAGPAGWLQLTAGIVHMFAAGAWIGAIGAFILMTSSNRAGSTSISMPAVKSALQGFAVSGSLIVGMLSLTGVINGLYLVGTDHIHALTQSTYGLTLAIKLLLFATMLGLAALNRFRLTPHISLSTEMNSGAPPIALLRRSLVAEACVAFAILGLVAYLGTLPPPNSG
jgi:copper resistance protein D